jgi:hypothetical protein
MIAGVGDGVATTSAGALEPGGDAVDADALAGRVDDGSGEPQPATTRMATATTRNAEPRRWPGSIMVRAAYPDPRQGCLDDGSPRTGRSILRRDKRTGDQPLSVAGVPSRPQEVGR